MNRIRTAAAAVAVLALAGCGTAAAAHPAGGAAACKAAMSRDYAYALIHPSASPSALPVTGPAACRGVPDATVVKLAGEIIGQSMGVTTASPVKPATAADIARKLGATDITDLSRAYAKTLPVSSEVSAVWKGRRIDVATFANEQDRQAWETASRQSTRVTDNGQDTPPCAIADMGPAT